MSDFENYQEMYEAFKIKINSKGAKRRKLKCPPGYHPNPTGTACVPIPSEQRTQMKKSARQAVRTKRAEGVALLQRTLRKTRKALKFRKSYGLRT